MAAPQSSVSVSMWRGDAVESLNGWVGRGLKDHPAPAPAVRRLPPSHQAARGHPTLAHTFPWMGHPQSLWAACASVNVKDHLRI